MSGKQHLFFGLDPTTRDKLMVKICQLDPAINTIRFTMEYRRLSSPMIHHRAMLLQTSSPHILAKLSFKTILYRKRMAKYLLLKH